MDDMLEKVLEAAQAHGAEDDPDHEVGDLQDLARTLWAHMTKAQRVKAYASFREDHEGLALPEHGTAT